MKAVLDEYSTVIVTWYLLVRALSFQTNRGFNVSTSVYSLSSHTYCIRLTHHTLFTNQQTVGGVDGEATGKGVVY